MAAIAEFRHRLAEAFSTLESRESLMVARLRRWCQQNSGSYNLDGLQAMADLLVRDFEDLSLPVHRFPCDPIEWIDDAGKVRTQKTGDILVVDHNPGAARRFLMMIHYDTVYPPSDSETPVELISQGILPEQRLRVPEKLQGPGTADAKGGLLVMLEAATVLRQFELDTNIGWTIAVNPDEEIGSPGSSRWIAAHASQFAFGMLFEPTLPDGALVSSRKGSGNFTIVVRGRSAHAGRNPEFGRNAIVHLCKLLEKIDSLQRKIEGITVNVAKIMGGTALNQVPDLAIGRFNMRVVSKESQQLALENIQQLVQQFQAEEGYSISLHGEFQSPPKLCTPQITDLQQRVERAGGLVGRSIKWRSTGGACDGSKLAAAGLPNIDTLGPTGDGLHSADEWVDIRSLVPAAKTVVALATEFALNGSEHSLHD